MGITIELLKKEIRHCRNRRMNTHVFEKLGVTLAVGFLLVSTQSFAGLRGQQASDSGKQAC